MDQCLHDSMLNGKLGKVGKKYLNVDQTLSSTVLKEI